MIERKKVSIEQFLEAIEGSGGLVSLIAKRLGISWNMTKNRIGQSARLVRAYNDECERMLDKAEKTIFDCFEDESGQVKLGAARFYLQTKGRLRGYAETEKKDEGEIEPVTIKIS